MSENDTVSARSLREQTSEEIRALLAGPLGVHAVFPSRKRFRET